MRSQQQRLGAQQNTGVGRPAGHRGERGAVLPIVLFFVITASVIVAAIVSQARSNIRASAVANASQDRVYAAGAALEWGLQQARRDSRLCNSVRPDQVSDSTVRPMTINGRTVTVTCRALDSGTSIGAGGYAIYTTATSGTTFSSQSGGESRLVVGPISNGGAWSISNGINVLGDVEQFSGSGCPTVDQRLILVPAPIAKYQCVTSRQTPSPVRALSEIAPSRPAVAADPEDYGYCRIFSPGLYMPPTSTTDVFGPTIGGRVNTVQSGPRNGQNYFRSGVYVLYNTDLELDNGQSFAKLPTLMQAGAPNNDDADTVGLSSRLSDCDVAQVKENNGVVFVLAGTSKITVGDAALEIFSYFPSGVDNRPALSVYQLTAAEHAAWGFTAPTPWPTLAIDYDDSANSGFSRLVIHGNVYTPSAGVSLRTTGDGFANLQGGLVSSTFNLKGSAKTDGSQAAATVAVGTGRRRLALTACVEPLAGSGEKRIIAFAQASIRNDATRTAALTSWRVDQDTTATTPCP
jgi:hypothetical protein